MCENTCARSCRSSQVTLLTHLTFYSHYAGLGEVTAAAVLTYLTSNMNPCAPSRTGLCYGEHGRTQ